MKQRCMSGASCCSLGKMASQQSSTPSPRAQLCWEGQAFSSQHALSCRRVPEAQYALQAFLILSVPLACRAAKNARIAIMCACRDKNCDIVIPRREVSRQHARLAVDDSGAVWLSSLGKEPVCVNGQPADEAVELYTGDQIEVGAVCHAEPQLSAAPTPSWGA